MANDLPHSRVYTFYSYKGGVGRSFAMANCATLLAKWGYRVICLDWDLEAPGLQFYFPGIKASRPGLVDWIMNKRRTISPLIQVALKEPITGELMVISAGKNPGKGDYHERLNRIDWTLLYSQMQLGERVEKMRDELLNDYDFVLIDSRTGITDIGGICTIHLADVVVAVLTANHQSIDGTAEVTEKIKTNRAEIIYDRSALKVLPILSRSDSRVEYSLSQEWAKKAVDSLGILYNNWLDNGTKPAAMMAFSTIPYITRWSYGEELAVLSESFATPEHISYTLENIAALIANGLEGSALATGSKDSYINAARGKGAYLNTSYSRKANIGKQEKPYSVYLSYSWSQSSDVDLLKDALRAKGIHLSDPRDAEDGTSEFIQDISYEMDTSDSIVVLLQGHVGHWQAKEIEVAVDKVFSERSGKTLLPVKLDAVDQDTIPTELRSLRQLDRGDMTIEKLAEKIVERIRGPS